MQFTFYHHDVYEPVENRRRSDPIYVFPEMNLRGLVSNFNSLYVSVSDSYIPTIGPPILLHGGNI
jgi:hypothetical protein